MPEFDITSPDGRKFHIVGPPGSTKEQALERVKRQAATPAAEPEGPDTSAADTGKDMARSLGRGVVKGSIGVAGTPGDIASLLQPYNPFDWLANKYRAAYPEQAAKNVALAEKVGRVSEIGQGYPTSAAIERKVEERTGPLGAPETEAGRWSQSIGEFAPSALMQPGGWLTKLLTTVGMGAGAQAGEELTGGSPWGRFFGSFFGGLGAARAATATQRGAARLMMASGEQNRTAAKNAINLIAQEQIRIDPAEVHTWAQGVRADLQGPQHLFRPLPMAGGKAFDALDTIEAANGDLATIMTVHGTLGKTPSLQAGDYVSAMVLREHILDFVENLQHNQLTSPTLRNLATPQAIGEYIARVWEHHRDTWRVASNLEVLDEALQSAHLRRMASGTGMNLNTMRQEVRKIIESDAKARRYSPAAREQMLRVVEGGFIRNLVRRFGKFAPHGGPVSAIPTIAGVVAEGPSTGGMIAALGIGGHMLSHLLENASMRRLEAVIRSGSPLNTERARRWFQDAPGRAERRTAAGVRAVLGAGAGSPLADEAPEE